MNSFNYNNFEIDNFKEFGKRYLKIENNVFEHNAWDNVDWSPEKEIEAQAIIKHQKSSSVLNQQEIEELADQKWIDFYKLHSNRFFKDRNWIIREFHELTTSCLNVYI